MTYRVTGTQKEWTRRLPKDSFTSNPTHSTTLLISPYMLTGEGVDESDAEMTWIRKRASTTRVESRISKLRTYDVRTDSNRRKIGHLFDILRLQEKLSGVEREGISNERGSERLTGTVPF